MEIFNYIKNLWLEYDLSVNLFSSLGAVYFSLIVSYFLTVFLLPFTLKENSLFAKFLGKLKSFLQYFPLILLGVFFLFVFPGSEMVEYLFLIVYSLIFLLIKVSTKSVVKEEYVYSARSFGFSEKEIASKVILKSLQPSILKSMLKLHINLWTILIALEFFKEGLGLGSVFKLTVDNNDFPAFVIISVILVLFILLGGMCISYIQRKFFFWEA